MVHYSICYHPNKTMLFVGLPHMTAGIWLPLIGKHKQLQLAAVIMLVDFMESISVAQTLARKNKYRINITQEILGMGVANFFGSMFNAYTTTGSFCRSAVLSDAGAKTNLAGAFTGMGQPVSNTSPGQPE